MGKKTRIGEDVNMYRGHVSRKYQKTDDDFSWSWPQKAEYTVDRNRSVTIVMDYFDTMDTWLIAKENLEEIMNKVAKYEGINNG